MTISDVQRHDPFVVLLYSCLLHSQARILIVQKLARLPRTLLPRSHFLACCGSCEFLRGNLDTCPFIPNKRGIRAPVEGLPCVCINYTIGTSLFPNMQRVTCLRMYLVFLTGHREPITLETLSESPNIWYRSSPVKKMLRIYRSNEIYITEGKHLHVMPFFFP